MSVELARAKVNLCLHVVGRRDDGMHLLDSLVVFPDLGDSIAAVAADNLSLEIIGPFADDLDGEDDNLVMRAARLFGGQSASLTLTKNLPIASGIGGGSADAAATLRVLSKMWSAPYPAIDALTGLGADIPVCLAQTPARMSGIGEKLEPLPKLPKFWIVLVNSGKPVATRSVFTAMTARNNAPIGTMPDKFENFDAVAKFLRSLRNDMESAAISICPSIGDVLAALRATSNCALSRMSGSGGTCFGVYATESAAIKAAKQIRSQHPDWWVAEAEV